MWEQVLFEYCEVQIKKRHTSFLYTRTHTHIYIVALNFYTRIVYICTPFFRVYVFILWQNFYYETQVETDGGPTNRVEKKRFCEPRSRKRVDPITIILKPISGRPSIPIRWMNVSPRTDKRRVGRTWFRESGEDLWRNDRACQMPR